MRQPCLDCGRPSEGSRCPAHRQAHSLARNQRAQARRSRGEGAPRPYDAEYRKQAAVVRATTVLCWICGKGYDPADPWQADHVLPGNPLSELRGAHRSCNIGRANKGRSKQGI
jgi:rubredoxin